MTKLFIASISLSAAAVIGCVAILGAAVVDVYLTMARRRKMCRDWGCTPGDKYAGKTVQATTCPVCGKVLVYHPQTGALVQSCRCELPSLSFDAMASEVHELQAEIMGQTKTGMQPRAEEKHE